MRKQPRACRDGCRRVVEDFPEVFAAFLIPMWNNRTQCAPPASPASKVDSLLGYFTALSFQVPSITRIISGHSSSSDSDHM